MGNSGFPARIFSGYWGACHCQGIAVDACRREIYFSFTTRLVKTDFGGKLIGTVEGLTGHLGCIDYCEADGRVYGSLEYKNDAIGKGILKTLGKKSAHEEAFYCAVFNGGAITRPGMDAKDPAVMRAVLLPDVAEAYADTVTVNGKKTPHRWGCSGIDGTGWGKAPGEKTDTLLIAAGIYGDVRRPDNDYQVLFRYNNALSWWDASPSAARADDVLFLYTGNTEWGVQNLEYDAFSGDWYLAVYPGKKPGFPNYTTYILDGARPPEPAAHVFTGESVKEVFLKGAGNSRKITGSRYPYGATGLYSCGDGTFLVSRDGFDPARGHYTCVERVSAEEIRQGRQQGRPWRQ